MAKEASSVIMEISDEEGEQIDGTKINYGRVEMQQGARSNYHKRSTRKNANSMAISSLKVKSVKSQHHLIRR